MKAMMKWKQDGYSPVTSSELNPKPFHLKEPLTHTSPLFDLREIDDYYLLAIDLPGLPTLKTEIDVQGQQLQVLIDPENTEKKYISNILFQCQLKKKGIQAKYQNGVLWLLLPKGNFRADRSHLQSLCCSSV